MSILTRYVGMLGNILLVFAFSLIDPIAHYTFDGTVLDNSDNNHDGSVMGTTKYVSGQFGEAFDFIDDSRVEFADNLFNLQSKGTVTAWINPSTVHTGIIYGVTDSSSSAGLWRLSTEAAGDNIKIVVQTRTPNCPETYLVVPITDPS